jgi:two-component system cell cycle sensor histidine kinase/response regulator CckA
MVSVLLVEDDSVVRHVVTTMLHVAGHTVVGAATPREARAAVAGTVEPFDLIVADVRLTESSGPELIAELRRLQPDARYLLMSGYAPDDECEEMPFLAKPFTSDELIAKIGEILAEPGQ